MARLLFPHATCFLTILSRYNGFAFQSRPMFLHQHPRRLMLRLSPVIDARLFGTKNSNTSPTDTSSSPSPGDTASTSDDDDSSIRSDRSLELSRRRSDKFWRRPVSQTLSVVGFVHSSVRQLLIRGRPSQWRKAVKDLREYLRATGLDQEFKAALTNYRLLDNIRILNRLDELQGERRERATLAKENVSYQTTPTAEEALRYMKFATAVYGDAMIRAAEMDVKGKLDPRILPVTKTRISEHCSIAEDDIVVLDVDFKGDTKTLRHLAAIDRENGKIVLAIRGTFSFSEVAIDIAGYTQAHSEMANMAETIWEVTGPKILELLQANPSYQLVVCGHSLGAGVACLLHVFLQEQNIVPGASCFAFAAPPTYSVPPPTAGVNCTNYIYQRDVVPFLSVYAIRQYIQRINAIDAQQLSWRERLAIIRKGTGLEALTDIVQQQSLESMIGAPPLLIPAAANVWICEDNTGLYTARVCDSQALTDIGIALDLSMTQDHIPSQYEQALSNFLEDGGIPMQ